MCLAFLDTTRTMHTTATCKGAQSNANSDLWPAYKGIRSTLKLFHFSFIRSVQAMQKLYIYWCTLWKNKVRVSHFVVFAFRISCRTQPDILYSPHAMSLYLLTNAVCKKYETLPGIIASFVCAGYFVSEQESNLSACAGVTERTSAFQ